MSNFYTELVRNATFYTCVSPSENCTYDENGHPLVPYNRILQSSINENEKYYRLYISTPKILDSENISEDVYISIFDFDDYITLIDNSNGIIKDIYIDGDSEYIIIPVDILNDLKVQKDRFARLENYIITEGNLSEIQEPHKTIVKKVKDYFSNITNVQNIEFDYNLYLLKNKQFYPVYKVKLNVNDEIDVKKIEEDLRTLFENRLFELSFKFDKNDNSLEE